MDTSDNFDRQTNEVQTESANFGRVAVSMFGKPFEDQTPAQILSRWRPVKTTVLPTTSGYFVYDPWPDLLAVNLIKYLLCTFVYFRTDIELKIVSDASPASYGGVFVSPLSYYPTEYFNGTSPRLWVLSNGPEFLDIAMQNQVDLVMKWNSPNQYANLLNVNELNKLVRMFRVFFYYTDTFSTEEEIQPFTFKIYARLTNVHTQGFIAHNLLADPETGNVLRGEAQMGENGWRQLAHRGGQMVAAGAVVGSTLLYNSAEKAVTRRVDRAIGGLENKIESSVDSLFDKTESLVSGQNNTDDPPGMGSQPSVAVLPSLETEPEFAAPVGEVKQSQWGKLSGCEPASTMLTTIRPPIMKDYPVSAYISKASCFLITTMLASEQFFTADVVHPSLIFIDDESRNGSRQYGRLSYLAQFYRFWRGSIRYNFKIICSPLASYKLRFILTWNYDETTRSFEPGDRFVHEVSVRGTTDVEFEVPYLNSFQYGLVDLPYSGNYIPWNSIDNGRYPLLGIAKVSTDKWVGAGNAGNLIIYGWKAAGSDFQYMSIKDPNPWATSTGAKDTLKGEAQSFGKSDMTSSSRAEGETFEAIFRRWSSLRGTLNNLQPIQGPSTSFDSCYACSPLEMMSALFLWRSGNIDTKVIFDIPETTDENTTFSVYLDGNTRQAEVLDAGALPYESNYERVGNGVARLNLAFANVLEYTHPMLCSNVSLPANTPVRDNYYGDVVGISSVFPVLYSENADLVSPHAQGTLIRAGQGFHYYYDVPPPTDRQYWYYSGMGDIPPEKKIVKKKKVKPVFNKG